MKIGIEAQRIFRANKAGMDIAVLQLIKALQKQAHGAQLIIFAQDGPDRGCLPEHVNTKVVTTAPANYAIWEQRVLPGLVKKYGVELLHCTSNTAPLKKLGVPLVITLHDIIYMERNLRQMFKGSPYQVMGNFYRRLIVPRALRRADKVLTVSHYEQERIQNLFRSVRSKLKVVYNGVGWKFFNTSRRKKNVAHEYGLPKEYFLHFGNTEPRKNTKRLLEAYAQYLDTATHKIPLALKGCNAPRAQEILGAERWANIEKYVYFPGYISSEDLPHVYAQSTALLFPSLREGFGLPPAEAMATNTVVLTSNNSSLAEVCGDRAVYVDPLSVNDLAAKMELISKGGAFVQRLRNQGLAQARKFCWYRSAQEVVQVYENTISEIGINPKNNTFSEKWKSAS